MKADNLTKKKFNFSKFTSKTESTDKTIKLNIMIILNSSFKYNDYFEFKF